MDQCPNPNAPGARLTNVVELVQRAMRARGGPLLGCGRHWCLYFNAYVSESVPSAHHYYLNTRYDLPMDKVRYMLKSGKWNT